MTDVAQLEKGVALDAKFFEASRVAINSYRVLKVENRRLEGRLQEARDKRDMFKRIAKETGEQLTRERETVRALEGLLRTKDAELDKMSRVTRPAFHFKVGRYSQPSMGMLHTYRVNMQALSLMIHGPMFDAAKTDEALRNRLAEQFAEGCREEAHKAMRGAILGN